MRVMALAVGVGLLCAAVPAVAEEPEDKDSNEALAKAEATEKRPREAADPSSVRVIEDSNLWPLAPEAGAEGSPGESKELAGVPVLRGIRGLGGHSGA
jgi:hypothetical protein